MISDRDMMLRLVEASPEFQVTWDEFVSDWADEPASPPYYLALGDFARHVQALHDANKESVLTTVFECVEVLHIEGDDYVKEAMTIGFLEALQNISASKRGDSAAYEKYLLPETAFWWSKLNNFWNKGELLVDERCKA